MKRLTAYAFTDKPAFKRKWAFRSEKGFRDKTAFLAAVVQLLDADRFRVIRSNLPRVANPREGTDDAVREGGVHRGQTAGGPAPERTEFLKGGKPLFALSGLKTPEGSLLAVRHRRWHMGGGEGKKRFLDFASLRSE